MTRGRCGMRTSGSGRSVSGVLNLNKPPGMTSRDVVDRISRPLRGVKVGHAGTLDPLASGVLVLCLGAATRLIEYVQRMPKTYRTVVRLGARSDTLDADGQVEAVEGPPIPTEAEVRTALAAQVGTIEQVPPQYSALKVGGRRAYDLAREGTSVELAARPVRIDRVELLAYEWPRLELEVDCGGGTYIRSIARDVGEALGCGGLVEVLTRTRIGAFRIEDAIDLDTIGRAPEAILARVQPPALAVAGLPTVRLDTTQHAMILQGRALDLGRLEGGRDLPGGEAALLDPDGGLAAVAEVRPEESRLVPRRVLAGA